jgi:hypothetical protein
VGISQPPASAAMAAAMDRHLCPEVVDVLAVGACAQNASAGRTLQLLRAGRRGALGQVTCAAARVEEHVLWKHAFGMLFGGRLTCFRSRGGIEPWRSLNTLETCFWSALGSWLLLKHAFGVAVACCLWGPPCGASPGGGPLVVSGKRRRGTSHDANRLHVPLWRRDEFNTPC